MNSYRQILYHIVFCTFYRKNTIPTDQHEPLFKYINGIIKSRRCVLLEINGTENHLHILCALHPSLALADLIKEIKTATNSWMKASGNYPRFSSWAEGSCSLTYSHREKEIIINYIRNQKIRHHTLSFEDEYRMLLKEHGIEADEKYIF